MEDGMDIPIGADFAAFQNAINSIIASIDRMSASIVAAVAGANSAMASSQAAMTGVQNKTLATATAQQRAASAASATISTFSRLAVTGANVGTAMSGIESAMNVAAKASRALAGVNLGTAISGWVSRAGGLRTAFSRIPAAMSAIMQNPTFRKIAIGAAAAIAGIIAIRTAWRVVNGAVKLAGQIAGSVFRGMVSAARAAAGTISGTFRGIASLPGKMLGSIPGLPIVGLLGAGTAVALLSMQLKGASKDAAVFEDMRISVEQFTGSAEAAKSLLDDLAKFAIKTPFETGQVQATATGLLGAGIKEDVAGITKDLAAMASTGQQLGELGDAVGKGFAKGKFQTEELNKFLERGINLLPALRAETGLTGAAFTKAVEKGLTFQQVTRAIRSMSAVGGQFYGMLEKRSQSFNGLISTLVAAWTDVRKAFGTPINDALKPILQEGIDRITALMTKAKQLGEKIGNSISLIFAAFKGGHMMKLFGAGLNVAVRTAVDILFRGFRGAVAFMASALPPLINGIFSKLSDPKFWRGLMNIFQGLGAIIGAEVEGALPFANQAKIRALQTKSEFLINQGGESMSTAGNVNMEELIKAVMENALSAAKKASGGPKGKRLLAAEDMLIEIMASLQGVVDANKPKPQATGKSEGAGIITPDDSPAAAVGRAVAPAVMSLSRVGGGGFANTVFASVLSEAKKQTGYLKKIAERGSGGIGPARFA
jgi:tape measure domain-containing protein